MAKKKSPSDALLTPPNFYEARKGVLKSTDDVVYGLPAVVRILSRNQGKRGFFIQEFEVLFASELKEDVEHEKTFIDHKNLKVIIKLPDPPNEHERESIRHATVMDYTLGVDDLKSRASLIVYYGSDEATKKKLIAREKKLEDEE